MSFGDDTLDPWNETRPTSDFEAVGDFHSKFGLPDVGTSGPNPHVLPYDVLKFRLGFMHEELREFEEAAKGGDLAGMADALIDLSYVVLGTAHYMGLPWGHLFSVVHAANMTKVRCGIDHVFHGDEPLSSPCTTCGEPRFKHSSRGSALDIIKPQGWKKPDIEDVLRKAGWQG